MLHRPSRRRASNTGRPRAAQAAPDAACALVDTLERRLALTIDLVPTLGYAGGVVVPGAVINVDLAVNNTGTTNSPSADLRVVLTQDTTLGNDDDVFLAGGASGIVPAGGPAAATIPLTVPVDLPQARWFLGFIVDPDNLIDETDETNNTDITPDTIVRNLPDIEALLTLSEPTPLPEPGDSIEVTFAFVNLSDFEAGPHTSRVVLSSDSIFGNDDDRVLFERDFTSIAPFASPGFVETLVIPENLAPGAWRLAVVADTGDDLTELSDENNQVVTSFDLVILAETRPDLVPDADFDALNTPTLPGLNLPVSFAVSNLTDFLAPASTARVVLTLDDVLGNEDDVLLGDADVPALGASASQVVSLVARIPADLAVGAWSLGIIADAPGAIGEQDEDNNTLLSPEPAVTVFAPSDVNIVIFGGSLGSSIIEHETKAQRSKGTGFGPILVDGETKSATFVIFNGGNDPLLLSGIEVRGQRPGDFGITALPEFTVAPGSTQSFTVTFDPTDFGTRRANVAIFSSDPDRPRFTMRIAGRGIPDPEQQDVGITGGADPISDNDRKARAGTGQRFGAADVGDPIDKIYTITNEGNSMLTFLSPSIRVTGTNAADFSVLAFPAHANLAPGATITFTIRFLPSVVGLRKATIEVLTDDPDEATFDFRVTGVGT